MDDWLCYVLVNWWLITNRSYKKQLKNHYWSRKVWILKMLLVEFCILLYVMLLCEIMHHSIETIACQPSGLSRECNISTVLHFSPPLGGNVTLQSPLLWPHCVYLKDLHKQVFIVINCFHCWKNATIRSKIARTHFQQTE